MEWRRTYPLQHLGLVAPAQLLEAVVTLLFEIGLLLDLCLVEAVDDGVLALRDEHALDLRGDILQVRKTSLTM